MTVDQRCAEAGGVNVHANVCVPARDRRRLERLCRYVVRPPVATARLSRLADGRLLYRLKRSWRDGTTHVVYEPLEFLGRLAALIPPPRAHQIRYQGCLGPAASLRERIVPSAPTADPGPPSVCTATGRQERSDERRTARASRPSCRRASEPSRTAAPRHRGGERIPLPPDERCRHAGEGLTIPGLERVLEIDALACGRCGERMQILGVVESPNAIRAILTSLSLPQRAPPDPFRLEPDDLLHLHTS